jgi:hypothetical protein
MLDHLRRATRPFRLTELHEQEFAKTALTREIVGLGALPDCRQSRELLIGMAELIIRRWQRILILFDMPVGWQSGVERYLAADPGDQRNCEALEGLCCADGLSWAMPALVMLARLRRAGPGALRIGCIGCPPRSITAEAASEAVNGASFLCRQIQAIADPDVAAAAHEQFMFREAMKLMTENPTERVLVYAGNPHVGRAPCMRGRGRTSGSGVQPLLQRLGQASDMTSFSIMSMSSTSPGDSPIRDAHPPIPELIPPADPVPAALAQITAACEDYACTDLRLVPEISHELQLYRRSWDCVVTIGRPEPETSVLPTPGSGHEESATVGAGPTGDAGSAAT